MTIQRYDFHGDLQKGIEPDKNGDYVLYSDHEAEIDGYKSALENQMFVNGELRQRLNNAKADVGEMIGRIDELEAALKEES